MAKRNTPAPTLARTGAPAPVHGGALANIAATLAAATPAPAAPAPAAQAPAPATPAPAAQAAPVVALRGGLAVQAVALTGKAYRVAAPHNAAWWATTQAAIAQGGGVATVAALVQAGVPAIMVGYLVRRGYCKPATVPTPATAS